MKAEDFLDDDFLKQFKDGSELTIFLEKLYKRGVEKILEEELSAHLDYEKHQKNSNPNARNGYSKKKPKTTLGETEKQVSKDGKGSFNLMLVKKRESTADAIVNLIISLYAKGMTTSDIEQVILNNKS